MIDPSFTRGEYWLLETAVTFGVPVSSLLQDDKLEEGFNKPGHGMERSHLELTLSGLLARGLIYVEHSCPTSEDKRLATVADISPALDGVRGYAESLYYHMTANGGANWEAFASPNWKRFIDHSHSYDDNGNERHTVHAANRELLQRIFDGLHYEGVTPMPETVVWTEISPWQATYWKKLPQGCRLEFASAPRTPSFMWDDMPLTYYWISRPQWYSWA